MNPTDVEEVISLLKYLMKNKRAEAIGDDRGGRDAICLSDSKSLIDIITGKKVVVALRGILHDIGVLSASFNSISFSLISRTCNEPADRLAKNALFQISNNLSEIANSV